MTNDNRIDSATYSTYYCDVMKCAVFNNHAHNIGITPLCSKRTQYNFIIIAQSFNYTIMFTVIRGFASF